MKLPSNVFLHWKANRLDQPGLSYPARCAIKTSLSDREVAEFYRVQADFVDHIEELETDRWYRNLCVLSWLLLAAVARVFMRTVMQ